MPTLVLKLVFVIIPTQAPFFVRPLVQMITSRVQHTFCLLYTSDAADE